MTCRPLVRSSLLTTGQWLAPIGSKNGRVPAGGYPNVCPHFGHFLAGFLEGEASFQILKQAGRANHLCRVAVSVRADDLELLQLTKRRTALGSIRGSPARGNANPQAAWFIGAKADCARLSTLLAAFPLRGRKSRDAGIWREAVSWWVGNDPAVTRVGRDWTVMAELKRTLHSTKAFDPEWARDDAPQGEHLPGWEDFLAGFFTAEGSLGIHKTPSGYRPISQLRVRQDDAELLRHFRELTGCGRLYFGRSTAEQRSPAVCWTVLRAEELRRLVGVFDVHLLRGRKRREYEVWREAALLWQSDLPRATATFRLARLREQLTDARSYRPSLVPQSAA